MKYTAELDTLFNDDQLFSVEIYDLSERKNNKAESRV
jgi:hypothetical protein